MIKIYLKSAWRNFTSKKWQSSLNIGGLAIGMAATLLIALWIYDELSYNKEFENYSTIARLMQSQIHSGEIDTGTNQPMQLAPVLRTTYGDHFKHIVTSSGINTMLLTLGEKKISRSGSFMEPGITEMLSLTMITGNRDALEEPNVILLSESTAKALFGTIPVSEKTIRLGTKTDLTVAGVYKDIAENTDFADLKFIIPWEFLKANQNYEERLGWGNNWFQMYAQVHDRADMSATSKLIKNAKYDNIINGDNQASIKTKPVIFLHPMQKWHLYSRFENGVNTGGAIERVWLLGIIGLLILLLACINFMNLSTARSVKRAKEVGIRKTIGSIRHQLVTQFFSESLLIVSISFAIALLLVLLCQPFFNEVTRKSLDIPWTKIEFWFSCLLFIGTTSILSSSYPAFYLSSFDPAKVLKGAMGSSNGGKRLRKALVVFQFTISIVLILGTISIFRQIEFAKQRPLGYDKEGLLYVPINTSDIVEDFESLREELLRSPDILEVAASDVLVTGTFTTNGGFEWKGKDPSFSEEFNTLRATHGYGQMINWELKEGRNFSRDFKSDSLAFILNETAVRYMGLENPVGEYVKWGTNGNFKIIGVAKDMVTQSPYAAVRPMIFTLHYGNFLNFVNIKIKKGTGPKDALAHMKKIFAKYDPASPFNYSFMDEEYAQNFANEERMGKLISFFAVLAILISCLGIFGLSAFIAEQRTKEIGIRKVLGASVFGLWKLLSIDFVFLVLLSSVIATPIGYYCINNWIQNYTYSASLSIWIFIVAILGAVLITLITVSFQAVKAAVVNPIKSLRTE